MMPRLAERFRVVAVDPRGAGRSDKPADGYDTTTLAAELRLLIGQLGHERFAVERLAAPLRPVTERIVGAVLPDCGHYAPEARPDALLDHLLPFLDSRTAKGRPPIPIGSMTAPRALGPRRATARRTAGVRPPAPGRSGTPRRRRTGRPG
ncbi:alpha/beta fold hydrolase [Streptomyces noursei]|uniref:alpha/beta fold hydrolase n=1 Tax=Streptomyces noursei TaxID=1971 RepID=UPI0036D3E916